MRTAKKISTKIFYCCLLLLVNFFSTLFFSTLSHAASPDPCDLPDYLTREDLDSFELALWPDKPRFRSPILFELKNQDERYSRLISSLEKRENLLTAETKYPLSKEDEQRLKQILTKLKFLAKGVRDELADLEPKELGKLQKMATDLRNESSNNAKLSDQYLDFLSIDALPKNKTVSINVGSVTREATNHEVGFYQRVVSDLAKRDYNIVIDCDTTAGPALLAAAGSRGIGVTSRPDLKGLGSGRIVQIPNTYLRLSALQRGERMVLSNDSITGVAMMLMQRGEVAVSPEGQWHGNLIFWKKRTKDGGNDIGLPHFSDIPWFKFPEEVASSTLKKGKPAFPNVKEPTEKIPALKTDDLKISDLERLLDYMDDVSRYSEKEMERKGGAAIYGSAGMDSDVEKSVAVEVYQVARVLAKRGYSVTTGGAMGLMVAANKGAFDVGGSSVGVPVVGAGVLRNETIIPKSVHTETLETYGYNARIPLLLNGKDIYIVAPGKSGTLREVAGILLEMTKRLHHGERLPHVFFLKKGFYESLFDWLRSHPALAEIRDYFHLISKGKDIYPILDWMEANKLSAPDHPVGKERSSDKAFSNKDYEKLEGGKK